MMTGSTDSLGRATFRHIAPRNDVRPTARELRWLKHIKRHGPQSSYYLYELTRDTHRCKDTALRQLQKIRAAGYLALPRQQRATERAEFNPYIYDLTDKAQEHLSDLNLAEPTVRPAGHWWHAYAVSCVTSSFDIAAQKSGIRYIPAHEILTRSNATLAIPVGQERLIPDQLFALDYGGRYRAFALEVDRGTEPKTSPVRRKSWQRSLRQYALTMERNLGKTHYGLNAPLLSLWIFARPTDEAQFLKMVGEAGGVISGAVLTTYLSAQCPAELTRTPGNLLLRLWQRASGAPLRLGDG